MKKFALVLIVANSILLAQAQQQNNDNPLVSLLQQKNIITTTEADSIRTWMKNDQKQEQQTNTDEERFKPRIRVSGVGHISYQLDEQNGHYSNTFNLVRVCGLVQAEVLKNVSLVGMYYFAPKAIQHMHEFYVRWVPTAEIGISVGIQKVPLSLGNLLSPATIETINPARAVMEITGGEQDITNGTNTGRDLGIEIFGNLVRLETHSLIDYKIGVFNGVGAQAVKDNNKYKDYVGMIFFQPIKGWKIGGSALSGKIGSTRESFRNRTIWNLGTEYDQKHFMVRSEYIEAQHSPTDRKGFYVLGLWKACRWADVLAVYDYFKKETNSGTESNRDYMAGINIKFNRMCRLQTFYIHRNARQADQDKNTFITQLQVGF